VFSSLSWHLTHGLWTAKRLVEVRNVVSGMAVIEQIGLAGGRI
jgi:hypothetical protein